MGIERERDRASKQQNEKKKEGEGDNVRSLALTKNFYVRQQGFFSSNSRLS